jgi:hypothetical protein
MVQQGVGVEGVLEKISKVKIDPSFNLEILRVAPLHFALCTCQTLFKTLTLTKV